MVLRQSITAQIAALNDLLRQRVMMPVFGKAYPAGFFVMTQGISQLTPMQQIEIAALVRDYDDFDGDNDPYGWRDFGDLDVKDVGKVFWKIDIFADDSLTFGADAPHDPEQSFRVLTIMLASEY
jgi:hypothetical protein